MRRAAPIVVALALVVPACGNGEAATVVAEPAMAAAPDTAPVVTPPVPAAPPTAPTSTRPPTVRTTDLRPAPIGAKSATAAAAAPVRVHVPSVGIDATVTELGLGADGAVETPSDFDAAGWYTGSVQPGQPGPAVLVGHVDSRTGPAAFFRLGQVAVGDRIEVHRSDASVVTFVVTGVEQHAKEQLAAEVVHGPVTGPQLRLVTCGGDFDRASGHYRDNIVVFASLA